jgi:hypothetical protein
MKKLLVFLLSVSVFIDSYGQGKKAGNYNNSTVVVNGKSHIVNIDSARAIARDAWIYGYPMFYNYKTIYLYGINNNYSDYAGGFNKFKNYAKMFTPADTSIVTPNDDTPYSWAMLNLATEPVILHVPEINNRYYVMQLIDLYTYNFAYVGTRATGNKAGNYMIAGPNWHGEKPAGVDKVFKSETDLVTILGRTELKGESDIPNIKTIQSQYKLIPLHEFTKQLAPAVVKFDLPLPVWKDKDYSSIAFIGVLNSLLQYASVHPSETALRKRFASIGIEPGLSTGKIKYSKEVVDAINQGIKEGQQALAKSEAKTNSSINLFGTREDLHNNYVTRATAAAMGLFGNTKEEAVYTGSIKDNAGKYLTGTSKYTLTFTKDQIPPVKYFWSITMYTIPQRYLVKNPINRYSIGDRTKGLKYEKDGSLIFYLQSTSPGKDNEANWLPSPAVGPFNYVVRLYGPKDAVTNGVWKQPLPVKQKQ